MDRLDHSHESVDRHVEADCFAMDGGCVICLRAELAQALEHADTVRLSNRQMLQKIGELEAALAAKEEALQRVVERLTIYSKAHRGEAYCHLVFDG
jgi:hypothetical protein